MKFKIHKSDLLNTLQILEKALPVKSVIESLRGIKIEVKENEIIFTASKNEMAIVKTMTIENYDIEIEEKGSIIISGMHFINIIKKIEANYINFEKIDNILHIKSNKSHIELIGYDISSYPYINFDLPNPTVISINKSLLINTYNKTKNSISLNPMKQILTGIHYNFTPENLTVSSTDSLRMTYYKTPYISETNVQFTIPKQIIQDINRLLEYVEEEEIEILFSNNQFLLKTKDLKIKSRLLDGEFPNIEKIIPNTSNFSYELEKEELLSALQRVLLLTEKNESVVTANIENNMLKLSSFHKLLGGIEEYCSLEKLTGSSFQIAFDPQFIVDALHSIDGENIKLSFIDEISAFTIKDADSDELINVISPIRIS